ncbi:Gfo/Idh/MocA family oxidoreductase [soil metagenome]
MGHVQPKLRFAVIGQGHFAQSAILPAFEQLDSLVELGALISGSKHKLDELSARYGVSAVGDYDDLDRILHREQIDAVYIAVPNDLHAEMTMIAARNGCHVLCEKPMAPSEAECMQMIRACDHKRRKLMVAYRLHFEAANLCAVELVRGGEIGQPRIFSSINSQQVVPGNIRVQPRRGQGPLFDIGVYCINAARYLFRTEPVEVSALRFSGRDPRFAHNDEAFSATLRFPDECVAQFTCSFGAHDRSHYEVIGTDGVISLDNAYTYANGMTLRVQGLHGAKERTFGKRDQIAAEISYFARCILEDRDPEPSGWEGLADVRIIQALQTSARFGRAVPIEPIPRARRPDLGQEIDIVGHEMPPLVDVKAPSK